MPLNRSLYYFALFLVLYELATYLANDMILPGMVQVIHEFHAANRYIAMSLSLFILGNCTLIMIAGSLAEHYGKRLMILLGSASFLMFTLLLAYSHSIHSFMAWRYFEGCGLAVITIGYGLIHSHFNDRKAVKLISLMGNVSVLAPLIGPILGTIIVSFCSWRAVFYFTLLLAIPAFIGLWRYTPRDCPPIPLPDKQPLFKQYALLLRHKAFVQGTLCIILITMPLLLWISQAPNLILLTLKQNYLHYVLYQFISIFGICIATFLMQSLAGNYSMSGIIKVGGYFLLSGLIFSTVFHANIWLVVVGQFFYTLGLGLANGCLYRLVLSIKICSTNVLSTLLGFSQSLCYALGIALCNSFLQYWQYSVLSFTLMTLLFGCCAFYMMRKTATFYQQRQWE